MDVREKLVNIFTSFYGVDPMYYGVEVQPLVDHLIANGVTVQERGSWKYYHKQNKAVCTNCSFERDLDANFGKAITCPNCGAKMDGGE